VNIEKFKIWLDELRARYFFDDICLVMDNLRVHHSNAAIERIDELGFEYIFTPPYSPDANPIESVFSIFKSQLKKERIKGIIGGKKIQVPLLIEKIWQQIEREKIINCIIHVLKFLKVLT
jgi:transposase